jgi:hypothetical protein
VSVCSSVLAGHLFAQSIPPQVKQAASIDQGSRQAIELAVGQQVKNFTSQDPAAQRAARDAIVGEVRMPTGEPSAAFQSAYADALSKAITKLPKDTPAVGLLNAAIAVQRVAEATKSTRLEPVIVWMLGPEQPEAVKLWGLKAARWVLPELARLKIKNNKLLPQVVPTVKANPSGAMTAEAYAALQVNDPAVVDQLLQLIELRASLYQGPAAPEDPQVEYEPLAFLSVKQWATLTQPQKVRVLQAICHLLVLGARHGDAAPGQTVEQEQLQTLVQQMGKTLQAIGLTTGNQPLQNVGATAGRATAPSMEQAVKDVCPTIKQIKGFEAVQEPGAGNAGTGPATGNGTGAGTGTTR